MAEEHRVVNVHERRIAAGADEVGALLDTWGSPGDQLWHSKLVEPTGFQNGLEVGSRGGHGPVRYRVVEHTPGRSVQVEFEPGVGMRGHLRFEVRPSHDGRSLLRNELVGTPTGVTCLAWPLLIRPIHDGAVEDMFDHVERTLTGSVHRPKPVSRLTRLAARSLLSRWVESCDAPPGALQAAALDRVDAGDCWTTPVLPGDPDDPEAWARKLFGRPPRLLLRLRDLLVKPLGLRPSTTPEHPETGFPRLAFDGDELLLGIDDRHLDFRVGIRVHDRMLHVTTTVRINNRLGRTYWSGVRLLHPIIVRRMLRRCPLPAGATAGRRDHREQSNRSDEERSSR